MPERFPRIHGLSILTCITGTCATHVPWCMPESLTSEFLSNRWRRKRSRHSRRMRNPQFYVSGKRPIRKAFPCHHVIMAPISQGYWAVAPMIWQLGLALCHTPVTCNMYRNSRYITGSVSRIANPTSVTTPEHNRHSVLNHWWSDCLFTCVFRLTPKKTSNTRAIWKRNPPVTSGADKWVVMRKRVYVMTSQWSKHRM